MIVELKGNIVFKLRDPFLIERTEEMRSKIEEKWNEFIKNKSGEDHYNGDVFLVTDIKKDCAEYTLEIGKTKYSDLVYIKGTNNERARSLFVASYIVTADNYYCVIKDRLNRINTIGGLADGIDFVNQNFVPQNCLRRELKEELGLDLLDERVFNGINARFIKIPIGEENNIALYPVGILYEIRTPCDRCDFSLKFEKNRSFTDGETRELMFYNKDNVHFLDQHGNPVSYIRELLRKLIFQP